jgi:pteridine reductase
MKISLKGQTALVTGGARRLGAAIAQRLAAEGMNVIIHYHSSAKEADDLAGRLRKSGANVWTVSADLHEPGAPEHLVEKAWELSGGFSILINNASVFEKGSSEQMTQADFERHMLSNAWTPFALSRAFARKVGNGQIVNMLDARVLGYNFTHVAYHLGKRALEYITRHMALELAPAFRVNAVAPGLILPPAGEDQSYLERLKETVPLKKAGDPGDIAEAVVYLLTNDFITGQTLNVDGGRHLRD